MSTKETLNQALREAMKTNDVVRKTTIRMVFSAIKYVEVDKGGELDEPGVLGVIQKEIKMRQDSIADAQKGNRQDLVEAAQAEMAILESFLPKQLDQAEIMELIRAAIAETGAQSARDMGNVMKVLTPKTKGRADGKVVSDLVRQALSG